MIPIIRGGATEMEAKIALKLATLGGRGYLNNQVSPSIFDRISITL